MEYGWLQIYHRGGMQQDIPLRDEITFGRAEDNDVVLNESTVSPYHAKIVCDSEGCWIVDLTSANGTYVDGSRLFSQQPQVLSEGTTIQIGNTRIVAYPNEVAAADSAQPASSDPNAPTMPVPIVAAPIPPVTPPLAPTESMSNPFMANTPPPIMRPPTSVTPGSGSSTATSNSVNLTLTTADLAAHAGGTAFSSIYVVNRSSIVNRIELVVDGVPPSWVTIKPNTLSLFPGGQGEAQVQISPPRDPNSRAGAHSFEVIARSDQFPAERTAVAGTLTILPYSEFAVDINPQQQTGRLQGTYEIEVANKSNSEQTFTFEGREAENAMTFRFIPPTLKVEPGQVTTVRARTRLVAWHWVGRPKIYPFTVNVAPNDQSAPAQQVSGRLVHQPPISPQLLMVLLPLMIMACGGLTYLWRYNKPRIIAAFNPTATPTVLTVTPTQTIFPTQEIALLQTVTPTVTEIVATPLPEPTLVPAPVTVPVDTGTQNQQSAPTTPPAPTTAPSPTSPPTGTPTATPTIAVATTQPSATPNPTATATTAPTTVIPTSFIAPTSPPLPTPIPPTNTPIPPTSTPLPLTIAAAAAVDPPSSRDCTRQFTFTGTITLNGPATVEYQWVMSNNTSTDVKSIEFTSAGAQSVYHTWAVTQPSEGWAMLQVLKPKGATSEQAVYRLTCDKQRMAYIYNNDGTSRDAFNQFFFNKEFFVDLVPKSAISNHPNATQWTHVVIGHDTSPWSSSAAETQKILSLGRPVLGLGNGGLSFLQAANLGGSGGSLNGKEVKVVNKQDSIWEGINTDANVPLYSSDVPTVAVYNPQAKVGLIRIGQQTTSADHYPIIAQEYSETCFKLWGFNGPPEKMTDQGRQVFSNLFFKDGCPPVISSIKLSITKVYCSGSLEPAQPEGNGDEIYFKLHGSTASGFTYSTATLVKRGVVRAVDYSPDYPPGTTPLEFSDPADWLQLTVEGVELDDLPEFNDGDNTLTAPPIQISRAELFAMFGTTATREFNLVGSNGGGSYRVIVSLTVQ